MVYTFISTCHISVVFMSPETATTNPWCRMFSDNYVKKHVVLVAVDEAHCISDWFVNKGNF